MGLGTKKKPNWLHCMTSQKNPELPKKKRCWSIWKKPLQPHHTHSYPHRWWWRSKEAEKNSINRTYWSPKLISSSHRHQSALLRSTRTPKQKIEMKCSKSLSFTLPRWLLTWSWSVRYAAMDNASSSFNNQLLLLMLSTFWDAERCLAGLQWRKIII